MSTTPKTLLVHAIAIGGGMIFSAAAGFAIGNGLATRRHAKATVDAIKIAIGAVERLNAWMLVVRMMKDHHVKLIEQLCDRCRSADAELNRQNAITLTSGGIDNADRT